MQGAHQLAQTEAADLKAAAEDRQREVESLQQALSGLREERDALAGLRDANEADRAQWEQERKSLRLERDELAALFKAEEAEHRTLQGAHQLAQTEAADLKVAAEDRQREVEGLQQALSGLREERDALAGLRDANEADRIQWEQERHSLHAQCEELAELKRALSEHEGENARLSRALDQAEKDACQLTEQLSAEKDAHIRTSQDHKIALESAAHQATEMNDALQKALNEAVEARDAFATLLQEEFELHVQGTKILVEALEQSENVAQALAGDLRQANIDKEEAVARLDSEVDRYKQANATLQSVLNGTIEERDALAASARTEFRLHLQGTKLLTETLEQNESVLKALTLEINHVQSLLVTAQENEKALAAQHKTELSQREQAIADLEAVLADAKRAREMIQLSSQEELARHIQIVEELTQSLARNDSVTQALAAELHHVQDELSTARENEAALMEINFQHRQASPLQRFTAWAGSAARNEKP